MRSPVRRMGKASAVSVGCHSSQRSRRRILEAGDPGSMATADRGEQSTSLHRLTRRSWPSGKFLEYRDSCRPQHLPGCADNTCMSVTPGRCAMCRSGNQSAVVVVIWR